MCFCPEIVDVSCSQLVQMSQSEIVVALSTISLCEAHYMLPIRIYYSSSFTKWLYL